MRSLAPYANCLRSRITTVDTIINGKRGINPVSLAISNPKKDINSLPNDKILDWS